MKKQKTKKYEVSLHRTYVVEIEATDRENASRVAEYYLGDIEDISNENIQKKEKFKIGKIELRINEAPEAVLLCKN